MRPPSYRSASSSASRRAPHGPEPHRGVTFPPTRLAFWWEMHHASSAQSVQDLAGVLDDHDLGVGLPGVEVDAGGVQVAEVDRLADLAGDARRQRDRDPVRLDAGHRA